MSATSGPLAQALFDPLEVRVALLVERVEVDA